MLSFADLAQSAFLIGEQKFEHEWITKKAMPAKRSDLTATTVDDAIYLVGGCALDQAWDGSATWAGYSCGGSATNGISASTYRYLPKSNTFETLANAPRPRYRHTAAAVNKKIYLFGGVDGPDNIISDVDVLDTVTGLWSTLAQKMPNPTTDLSSFVYSGKVYIVGGYNLPDYSASKVTQVFEPDASTPWSTSSPLVRGRGDHFAAVVDNKAYVVGGFHHENNYELPISSLEKLDLSGAGTTWTTQKAMNVSRGDKAVAVLNKMIHVVGGETKNHHGHSVPLHDVEVYNPNGNTWYFGGNIPSKRFRFAAAAHGNSIFIFGGQGYLVGTQNMAASFYPIVDTVEEYLEKVSGAQVSKALSPTMQSGFISVLLSTVMFFSS